MFGLRNAAGQAAQSAWALIAIISGLLPVVLVGAAVVSAYAHDTGGDYTSSDQPVGHEYQLQRTATGVYYESYRLPIDPVTKSILATVLSSLGVIAFFSMMEAIGKRGRNERTSNIALWVHRINGYAFIALAIFIAQYCIRILGTWGHLSEAAVNLHIVTAIAVLMIPVMKFGIARRYKDMKDLLPAMGISLIVLTWITTAIILIHFFRG